MVLFLEGLYYVLFWGRFWFHLGVEFLDQKVWWPLLYFQKGFYILFPWCSYMQDLCSAGWYWDPFCFMFCFPNMQFKLQDTSTNKIANSGSFHALLNWPQFALVLAAILYTSPGTCSAIMKNASNPKALASSTKRFLTFILLTTIKWSSVVWCGEWKITLTYIAELWVFQSKILCVRVGWLCILWIWQKCMHLILLLEILKPFFIVHFNILLMHCCIFLSMGAIFLEL